MLDQTKEKKRRGCGVGTCLVWFALSLTALLLLLIVVFYGSFRSAEGLVRAELKRIREAGEPTDDASMADWFRLQTHSAGTDAWKRILAQTENLIATSPNVTVLPIVGAAELPALLQPGDEWPAEPNVAEFLNAAKSVISSIEGTFAHPTPVWMPIEFKGYETLLPEVQSARQVSRLLRLEFVHAMYQQDGQRAKRALKSMKLCADAFDWQTLMITDLVHTALLGMYLGALGKSLDADLWDETDLVQFMEQLSEPPDVSQRWNDVFAGERYWFLSESGDLGRLTGSPSGIPDTLMRLPYVRLKLLGASRRAQALGEGDLKTLVGRMQILETEIQNDINRMPYHPGNVAMSLLMPAHSAYATSIERSEDGRRFIRTAVATKLFHFRNGRWPSELSELEQLGVAQDDWSTLNFGPFGYSIEDNQAWLWSYSHSSQPDQIPATRPELVQENAGGMELLRIR